MANLDAPNGFVPSYHLHGGTIRYNGNYRIADAYDTDLFLGDVVALPATKAGPNNIVRGAATGQLIGIFAGCQYTAANGDVVWEKQWRANTTTFQSDGAVAFVYVDPNIVYTVQVDGTISEAAIGQFAPVALGTGNSTNGVSGDELSATTADTVDQFRIINVATQPEGILVADLSSANPRVEVQFAQHEQIGNLDATA